jgi:shikimate kinase
MTEVQDRDGSLVQHIVLVGMTGSGKSSVGRLLADRLHRDWLDSDQEIERRTGSTVREIFTAEGEPGFRKVETEILSGLLAHERPAVISTGGGIVLSEENRKMLNSPKLRVVWLMADPSVLLERVHLGMHRPLLDQDPEGTLARMWEQREALYREVADLVVSVDNRSVSEVAEAILR